MKAVKKKPKLLYSFLDSFIMNQIYKDYLCDNTFEKDESPQR